MINILINPLFYLFRPMDRVAVNNEKDFAFALTYQTSKELQKDIPTKTLFEHHKIELSLIGDGRDHIATKAFSGSRDHWCLTTTTKRTSHRMIRAKSHLIAPINPGFFMFRFLLDRRVLFLKPATYCLRVFLKRPADWFLRCKTPASLSKWKAEYQIYV